MSIISIRDRLEHDMFGLHNRKRNKNLIGKFDFFIFCATSLCHFLSTDYL